MSRKKKVEEENRSFNEQWIENYLFYENRKGLPSCLVRGYSCPVNKEYNVRRHFDTTHAGKYGELAGRARSEEVRKLLVGLKRQQDAFKAPVQESEACVRASYKIAFLLAKHNYPFSGGSFVKGCIRAAFQP